jgi:diguanylate cyclase (GGDEF)-like protein
LGAILSIVGWIIVLHWEERAIELEFGAQANNVALTLQAGMDEYFKKIFALRALFKSSEREVSRVEFDTFARELLKGQSAILSVSWIPRVTRDERPAHELAAIRDGIVGYRIKSVAPDGKVATAPDSDEYYPVYYTTEKQYLGVVHGLDLVDGGVREEALKHARDRNELAASKIIALHSGTGDRRGFFVLLPVYKKSMPHETLEDRRHNITGFVQGVFQLNAMIETIIGSLRTPLDLNIFAPDSGPNAFPIYIHSSSLRTISPKSEPLGVLTAGRHWSGTLEVADLKWTLLAMPIPGGHNANHVSAWLLLIAGFLASGVVVILMWSSARHELHLLRTNQKMTELAQTDALTNLANRRALIDRLSTSFAASRRGASRFALLYIDLDGFKDVNDTLGHLIGDVLLQQAAERLKGLVRNCDLVARLGGDEFAVLQGNAVDFTATGALAKRIVANLGKPYFISSNEIHISASVGISDCFAELDMPEVAMMQADLALYRAKEDGRNCFRVHNKEFDQRVRDRVKIGDELRAAIIRGELELYYQPQVEIVSGQIVGLEALVRWNNPKLGLIAPSLFIPIAEKTGNIIALGKWVFEEACRQTKIWENEGIAPQSIAVNLSAIQCKRTELDRDIAESIEQYGINPGRMEIELTESVLMEVTQEQRDLVERLRALGLTIAIDDFGTGYSSLNYLATYPVDRLKIAQELVFRVTTDPRHATVVRTAIRLAQELGIEIIAEGVETAGQALFLVSAGCRYAQGYYFSRPVSVKRATELLRQKKISPINQSEKTKSLTAA